MSMFWKKRKKNPETNEEVWLEEVKPRRRVTKKELEKEIFRLRNKLEDRDGRKALLMMHMIAEVAAIITLKVRHKFASTFQPTINKIKIETIRSIS